VSACGGDDDAPALDPAKLAGEWRAHAASFEQPPEVFVFDPANGAAGYAGSLAVGPGGAAGALEVAGSEVTIGDSTWTFEYQSDPERLIYVGTSESGDVERTEYERIPHAPLTAVSLAGKATTLATTLDSPRVALVAMLRDNATGGVKFFVVPCDVEAGIDTAVDFAGGTTADFALARTEGALGVERIAFGTTGFAAVNAVVAYEDRDHDGKLGRFDIDACTDAALDCIRGVSPLVLAERDGDSAELQAAGYGLMREGWAVSVVVPDARRTAGTTIVPLDPTVSVTIPVTFSPDSANVKFPNLKF
jgi:hypothetical protein